MAGRFHKTFPQYNDWNFSSFIEILNFIEKEVLITEITRQTRHEFDGLCCWMMEYYTRIQLAHVLLAFCQGGGPIILRKQ